MKTILRNLSLCLFCLLLWSAPAAAQMEITAAVLPLQSESALSSSLKQTIHKSLERPLQQREDYTVITAANAARKFKIGRQDVTQKETLYLAGKKLEADLVVSCRLISTRTKRRERRNYDFRLSFFDVTGNEILRTISESCKNCTGKQLGNMIAHETDRLFASPYPLGLDTDPSGASVTYQGEKWGITPLRKMLKEGNYKVLIEKPGYKRMEVEFPMPSDRPIYATLPMQEDPDYIPPVAGGILPPIGAPQAQPAATPAPASAPAATAAPAAAAPATAAPSDDLPPVQADVLPPIGAPQATPTQRATAKPAGEEVEPTPAPVAEAPAPVSDDLPPVAADVLPPMQSGAPPRAATVSDDEEPPTQQSSDDETPPAPIVQKEEEPAPVAELPLAEEPVLEETAPLQTTAKAPDSMSLQRKWAWRTVGIGVASAIGGLGLTLGALHSDDRAGDTQLLPSTRKDYADRRDNYWIASYALYGLAGAAVTTSLILFFTEKETGEPTVSAAPALLPDGAGVCATIRY